MFWLIASLTGLCAIATVITQNIVRSATWLLFTLAGTSGIFFLLGADLIGAVQLLVYVGGTMVLVVFGVMLTAQGPFISMKTSGAEWAISIVAGILLFAVLCFGATSYLGPPDRQVVVEPPGESRNTATVGLALLGAPFGPTDLKLSRESRIHYLLPFEIVSIHLLVVLIGAAYLARAKRRKGEQP
ncbi:MAG: NADH-quinone oxidoreductase subunit J [Planctomycetes bacterium]|nr:NADH-quinone oxidoreductase subunit J [Planctomycetota bacterium]